MENGVYIYSIWNRNGEMRAIAVARRKTNIEVQTATWSLPIF